MHVDITVFTAAALALFAGHHLGDYWLQSDRQAQAKGGCGRAGRTACAGHVSTLTAAQGLLLVLVIALTGVEVSPAAVGLGLALNALSHYWADRRFTLRGLVVATEPLTAKRGFYDNGGAAHLDQAWHVAWLVPSALIAAAPLPLAGAITAACLALLVVADVVSRVARRAEARTAA
ncbi:hypothetical protein HNR12_002194 [Streptomonospora nanhaiensis]|uniref:DUF3307 domain-containing protein n=1 Tax=Streptomonospora nanhaiensis TaxID=1323731 RepID=A0A853BMM2_9ACTN|nr:DUF3307 domain-containing protein [Streptomonospora nanhaiensis]NYI95917.1 hypothetical protein [Streptomonospora nanhaiensis]